MASLQEAVANAIAFAQQTLGPTRTFGIQLEEIEVGSVNGRDSWLITLSMIKPDAARGLTGVFSQREYKIFTALQDTGEVTAMKIRELEHQ